MPDHRELSLGQRCYAAMVDAAEKKADALRLKKVAERTFDRLLLDVKDAKTVAEREAKARLHEKYIAAEDAAIEAESQAIIAKAKSDGMQIGFEEWRSTQATTRAEMNLR